MSSLPHYCECDFGECRTDLLPLLRSRRVVYRGTALQFSVEPARPQIHLSSTPGGARAKIEFQLPDGRTTGFETSPSLGHQSAP